MGLEIIENSGIRRKWGIFINKTHTMLQSQGHSEIKFMTFKDDGSYAKAKAGIPSCFWVFAKDNERLWVEFELKPRVIKGVRCSQNDLYQHIKARIQSSDTMLKIILDEQDRKGPYRRMTGRDIRIKIYLEDYKNNLFHDNWSKTMVEFIKLIKPMLFTTSETRNTGITKGGLLPMITIAATAKSRINLSIQHMQEAIHLMELSKSCEVANSGKTFADGDFFDHHRAYVVCAIMTSVASVEALINEFYLDATDKLLSSFLDIDSQELLKELWSDIDKKGFSLLNKYQIALVAIKSSKFDIAREPYQGMNLLIDLRNMLVHFKPEWDDNQKKHKTIEKKLRGRFELNPFWPENNSIFFPFKCMSYGCACWAVNTSINFIFKFLELIRLDHNSDRFKIWETLRESL